MSIFFWGVVHLEDPFETKYAARLCTGAHFAALWQHLKAWVSLFIVFLHPNPCVCGTWNRLKTDCKMCSPCLDPVPCSAAWKQHDVLRQKPFSHEKNPPTPTFHYTGCLIGILTMVYCNPYVIGSYNPLYTLNNQGVFHCSGSPKRWVFAQDTSESGRV